MNYFDTLMIYLFRLTLIEVKKIFISKYAYVVNLDYPVMTLSFGTNMIFATQCGIRA
jgi:hypothetical protein